MSRSLLLTLRPIGDEDMRVLIGQAVSEERGLGGMVTLADDAQGELLRMAGGDARRALTYLEAAALGLEPGAVIDMAGLAQGVYRGAVRYHRAGRQHYHMSRAFIKNIRGSDVGGAPHCLALISEGGS